MTESVLITSSELDAPGPTIIYVNPAFEKMTGWKRSEVIGMTPRILQGAKTDYKIFRDLRDRLSKGEIWSGRTVNYKKDGSEFYMEWSIVPINYGSDHQQYLSVQKDVTEIVRTENKLQIARDKEQRTLLEIKEKNRELEKLIIGQKKTLDLFNKYVPEPIVKRALSQKKKNIREGERLEVALLFCDIRRFTTIAEGLDPQEIVHFLNVYYSIMSDIIKMYNGVINQFVGDEIFVSFGAPVPIDEPEISAVRCAREMVAKLEKINDALKDTIDDEIAIGIGINFGPIIAGNLGSDDRLSYSITGDAVNTAKRIESLTGELKNAILVSQSIYDKTSHIIHTKPWGEVLIKGKNKKVNVFQVVD
ncbi:MAG: PAS domain S-box protein [Cytophagales bacterium]|nr:PAS domain S-box protein [Cytophagales bacterium]